MQYPDRGRFRITQSLLSAWKWSFALDGGYEDFLRVLRRERTPPTQAMLDGVRFEGMVNAHLNGVPLDESHEWAPVIREISGDLHGARQQVTLFRELNVGRVPFLLHGVFDFLRAGVIYDTKFSKRYKINKYLMSPQHPMYFALAPEAYLFEYLISDGRYIYREKYRRGDCEPIVTTIKQFMDFLEKRNLVEIYCGKWKTKG